MKTNATRSCSWGIATILCVLATMPCRADDATAQRRELGKWIMTYYVKPTPELLVEKVKAMAAAGILHDERPNARPDANVMFLGKVMEANAEQIPGWMAALESLPKNEFTVLKRAAWYSGTAEGSAWLKENGEAELVNGPRPVLFSDQKALVLQPHHLDQLWEWFFATGDETPVLRIISLLSLAHEPPRENSLTLLAPPKKSDDKGQHQIQVYNYRLLKPALWSLTSLAIQDDRVLEIVKRTEEKHAQARTEAWLGQIRKIAETERAKRIKKKVEP